ncbi:MAG: ATP-binding protein [Patescibacteria group bacterium]
MDVNNPSLPLAQNLDHERLTSLINSMADGVMAVDEKCTIVLYNGAMLNILDVNNSMVGLPLTNFLKLFDKNSQPVDVKRLIFEAKTASSSRDWLIHYPDGSQANLYISIAPVRLSYGQDGMKGYVVLVRDITREKSLEEERDEFISVVSHELRTPIAISEGNIGNAAYLFNKSGVQNDKVKEALKVAHEQINFLSAMINDLATLSRAERGKLTVEIESINISQLTNELHATYKPQAQAKNLDFSVKIDPKLEILNSSKLYVREIIQNFVTNAIKYTNSGHVLLSAQAKPNGVEFTVSDTGIGISKADQEKVFDKFFRSEDFRTRQSSGTGLGLYVTMKLAKLLHAELTLLSELDKGTTFTIFIPNLTNV